MSRPVIAIGLDAAEASLLDDWTDQGHLPNLARLKAQGIYGRLEGTSYSPSEVSWPIVFTGCWPKSLGYWQHVRFHPDRYGISRGAYDYVKVPPFFALGTDFKVASFDLPDIPLCHEVRGLQVLAWGAHSPCTPALSDPPALHGELTQRYGPHPAFHRDHARIWQKRSMRRLHERLLSGIARRAAICRDLLKRERWDLFLTVFSETHSGGHYFWHCTQPDHPLTQAFPGLMKEANPLLTLYQAIDRAIGEIVEAAPSEAQVVIFSQEGMETSNLDLCNMAMMPELLYRHCFAGRIGLGGDGGPAGSPAPKPRLRPMNLGWVRSVWASKSDPNPLRRLLRKTLLMEAGARIERLLGEAPGPQYPYRFNPYFSPGMWYSPYWPRMRAFALPAVGDDGHVRLNLQGRERDGIVAQTDYDTVCQEIGQLFLDLRDPRSGARAVREVIRLRSGNQILDPGGPQGDLLVRWENDTVLDVVDHPELGRIGPFAQRRSGGHHRHGFLLASGPGLPSGQRLRDAELVDLAPLILDLMGARPPGRLDGRSPIAAV